MEKNKMLTGIAALLFMGFLFVALSCKNKKTASSTFRCESVSYNDIAEKPTRVFAYIDASGSMKGYFSLQSDGRFITALSDVNPDRINWMDANFSKLEGLPTNALLTNKFTGGQSRFDMMLPSIIKRDSLSKNNDISLLFTDGILSASKKETDINPNYMKLSFGIFKNYIANALKETPGIAIAIFKLDSKYNGSYWNYQNKDTSVNIPNRPFYVIVMGKPALIRYFSNNNKLDASFYVAFGVYDNEIRDKSGTFFAPVAPKDFKGDKLVSNTIAFTLTLPDNVSQYGDAYIKKHIKIKIDGKDESQSLKSLIRILGNQLTIDKWNTNDPSCPILALGTHTLQVEISHSIPTEWIELYSEDDLNIKNDITQQKSTFALEYLIKGIQEGVEKQTVIFSSSITFTK